MKRKRYPHERIISTLKEHETAVRLVSWRAGMVLQRTRFIAVSRFCGFRMSFWAIGQCEITRQGRPWVACLFWRTA